LHRRIGIFASVEEIALAKRELIEGLNGRDSVAVLNADDPLVAAFASQRAGPRVYVWHREHCRLSRGRDRGSRRAGTPAFILMENGRRHSARTGTARAPRHFHALAALAAASVWGIGAVEAQSVFRSLHAPSMRGELLRFSNGAALINDSYKLKARRPCTR